MGWLCSGIGRLSGNVRAKLSLGGNNLTKPHEDLNVLLALMETGRVWVKLAPTRVTAVAHRYDDLEAPITRLMAAFPERCLWGSDWPHVMTAPPLPRITPMLDLCRMVLTPAQQTQLFDTNPAQLYRF